MDKKATQFIESGFLAVWLATFLAINFSNILGLIYIGFIVAFTLRAIWDDKISIPISNGGNWFFAIVLGIGTYIVFTLFSTWLIGGLLGSKISIASFMKIYGATLPALAESKVMAIIAYAFFIPFVETVSFLSAYEYGIDKLRYSEMKFSDLRTWFPLIIVSLLFVVFHLTAKGINNVPALIIVGLMMFVSIIITCIFKDMRPAIAFHMISNLIALLLTYGFITL